MSIENIGKPHFFDHSAFLKAAEQLVDADEVERALALLDNIPAYYRDHVPEEILAYKNKIMQHMITAHGYMNDAHDCNICTVESARNIVQGTLRGRLIEKELNLCADEKVHVVEVGPGEYWLPIGLDRPFAYTPVAMDSRVQKQALADPKVSHRMAPASTPDTRVFVACEVIEHISNPRELVWESCKHFAGLEPHYIHLSTPYYTYDGKPKDWSSHKLPHLRAYTPREFIVEAQKLWPHYEWQLYLSPVMSLRGLHPSAKRREHLL
jgi:hypothetical protein